MYDSRDMQLLQETLARYEQLINLPLLHELSSLQPCKASSHTSCIQLIEIKNWPTSSSASYFQYILNALGNLNEVIGYLLSMTHGHFSIYIGLKGDCTYALKLLQEGLVTSFPGIEINIPSDSHHILKTFFNPSSYAQLAAVTVIPNSTLSTSLLTTFTSSMGSAMDYNAFFLAAPYPNCQFKHYLEELCELYYILSTFSQATFSHSTSLLKNSTTTITTSKTVTHGDSRTETDGSNETHNCAGYTNTTASTSISCPVLNNQNFNLSYLLNKAYGHNQGSTNSLAEGRTYSQADGHSNAKSSAEHHTTNHGINYSAQNKCVQNALATLSDFITRIQTLLQTTVFQYSSYFFASNPETTTRAAYSFLGLATNSATYLGASAVNLWDASSPYYKHLFDELAHFEPLDFCGCDSSTITPATFINSSELLNSLYLPFS